MRGHGIENCVREGRRTRRLLQRPTALHGGVGARLLHDQRQRYGRKGGRRADRPDDLLRHPRGRRHGDLDLGENRITQPGLLLRDPERRRTGRQLPDAVGTGKRSRHLHRHGRRPGHLHLQSHRQVQDLVGDQRRKIGDRLHRSGHPLRAQRRLHDAERGGGRQPDDHRQGQCGLDRHHLQGIARTHLRRRRGQPQRPGTDRGQQRRHRDRLRLRHRAHLHQRRRLGVLLQERRDEALQGRRDDDLGQRRDDRKRTRPDRHGGAAGDVEADPERGIGIGLGRGRRRTDDHRQGHLRQRGDLLHRLQEPRLRGCVGQSQLDRADGDQRVRHRGRLRRARPRPPSPAGSPPRAAPTTA